ncbi:hypothetical protein [Alkalicoccus chagannorensis]|uniref:hypothetical protein n=1 Tax=Alkalicoccus chagannorensis TaxID=427072 RepID=UPI0012EB331A|nr:hypothetical protein [Alkalicoccus chagannorensis]
MKLLLFLLLYAVIAFVMILPMRLLVDDDLVARILSFFIAIGLYFCMRAVFWTKR